MMELSSLESKSSQDFFLSHDKKISQLSPTLSPIGDKAFNIFQIRKVDSNPDRKCFYLALRCP